MEQKKTPLRFILNTAGKYKGYIGILTLVQAVLGASGVLYAFFLRDLINVADKGDTGAFWRSCAGIILLVLVQLVCRTIVRHLEELAKSNIENAFKKRLFGSILVGNYGEFVRIHSAQWMNRLTSDARIVTDALVQLAPSLVAAAVRLVAAFGAISFLEPRFLYLLIPGGILLVGISYIGRKKMKRLHKDVQKADDSLRSKLQDFLVGMAVVRSYSTEQFSLDSVSERLNQHKKMRMRRNVFTNICYLGLGILMQGAYLLCAVFCGYGILTGTMDFGSFTALLQLTGQIQTPIANVSGYIPQYYTMIASAERLMEAEAVLLQDAAEGAIVPCDMQKVQEFYGQRLASIGLDHVSFSYPESEGDTLNDFSIEIVKGQTVALMGLSGCGKSTIMKLLMGLYTPQQGHRFVRTTDGGEGESAVVKNLFAYVPQGNDLMSGTIREIIAFADMSAMYDEERIRHALEVSCSDSFVDELEHGVDTELGEQGAGLSEGQMQRLAIARAVFSEHPILLLDECTSALDGATEERLLKNLKELTDKTTIIITHRPAALDICDTVCEVTKLQK